MNPSTLEIIASSLFAIAIVHTFSSAIFHRLSEKHPNHGGLFHLLGEVEVVFGFWALILVIVMAFLTSAHDAVEFVSRQNYTEPMFVFAVMVVAASKPILSVANLCIEYLGRFLSWSLRIHSNTAVYFISLSLVPLLGSFITEPAAMTLAALLLRDRFYKEGISPILQYATLGVLFVNVSIGGTLTNFAAPPVLMVASRWEWTTPFMLNTFGLKAVLAVFTNAFLITVFFNKQLPKKTITSSQDVMPYSVIFIHLLFLAGVVIFAHYAAVFMWLFLFFLGYTQAYSKFQNPLILRESLLVAFFLAGLVVLGSLQKWWLQPILESMSPSAAFYGTTLLTALTDNAALTYLGSLVEGTSPEFKIALVAGAVSGGGLTVIANAPNPAGLAILREHFHKQSVSGLYLLLAALIPTIITIIAFRFL